MKPALQKKKKKVSHGPTFCVFSFLKRAKGNRNDSADSTVTVMSSHRNSGVDHFSGATATKGRRGRGLSPWKHPPWTITTRVDVSTRKKKIHNQWKSPVFDTVFFFFLLFNFFFLKCSFFESFFRSLASLE